MCLNSQHSTALLTGAAEPEAYLFAYSLRVRIRRERDTVPYRFNNLYGIKGAPSVTYSVMFDFTPRW